MNTKYLYRKLTKIKKTLPGNKYEKGAMIDVLKFQTIALIISIIFILFSFYFNKNFIYALVFLFPIIPIGTYAIPMVLQEPNQPNRFNALSHIFFGYFIVFILSLIFILITMWINYKVTLIAFVILYIISIYGLIYQIKKSINFNNKGL